jgi:L-fuconolactonase
MSDPTPFGRVLPLDKAWLARLPREQPIEPELPIVDTHHHLWGQLPAALPQGDGGEDHTYLLEQFAQDFNSGHNTIATVYVECHGNYRTSGPAELRPVGETEFAAAVGASSDQGGFGSARVCAGIVGSADLTLGARVRPVLEAHLEAGQGRFRGVRATAGYDADPAIGNTTSEPGIYRRPEFRAGVAELTELGLSLDAWVFFTQLGDVVELARACPDTSIIMGHCGGPLGYGPYAGRRDEVFSQWKRSLGELAACPNVSLKLGGMMIRLAAIDYRKLPAPPSSEEIARLWGPYIETCIELFGASRCMFESNFPVEKLGADWVTLWNAFKRITASCSADEKRALFSANAQRVYQL